MNDTGASQALVEGFIRLYPQEAAEKLERLPTDQILTILQSAPPPYAARVLVQLNSQIAAEILLRMEDDRFREVLPNIDPTRAAGLLARLDSEVRAERLKLLPERESIELRQIMSYPPDRAGHLMDPRVASFRPSDRVETVLARLRLIRDRRISDILLVDGEGRLTAALRLQEVAASNQEVRLETLVQAAPIAVNAMATREEVVELLRRYQLASLPVVDLERRLLGVIRYDALIEAAQQDATLDIQTMVGAGREERALSRIPFAFRKRLPWLEINLGTAFLAAAVVGLFEGTIAKFTALAVLLPVVAGQSGNTGAQALAVIMRGLALREVRVRQWFRVLVKEAGVAFLNGLAVAVTTAAAVYVWSGSFGLTAVIGVAMVISMVIAGVSGAAIPMLLTAFGQDPAQSSSIILTTVTDVVGFFSFLGLATLFSHLLVAG